MSSGTERSNKPDMNWVIRQAKKVYKRCMQEVPVKKRGSDETGCFTFDPKGALSALEFISSKLLETPQSKEETERIVFIEDLKESPKSDGEG